MTMTTEIDARTFWRAIGSRVLGACVAAARDDNGPAGLLALSATHVSAAPPTMMMSVGKSTSALSTILRAGHFSLNVLTEADATVADLFSGRSGVSGAARFTAGRWDTLVTGAPALIGAMAVLDCKVETTVESSDAHIIIGRVMAYRGQEGRPLVSFGGKMLGCDFHEATG